MLRLLLIIVVLQLPLIANAQENVSQLLKDYEERFNAMEAIMQLKGEEKSMLMAQPKQSERIAAIDKAINADIDAELSKTGVVFSGQSYLRPGKEFSYDSDDPLVAYNAKAQAEVQWDFLQSGLFNRAAKRNEHLISGEIQQLNFARQISESDITAMKESAKENYEAELIRLLREHDKNLELLLKTQTFLLQNGKISSDELLTLINQKAEVRRQIIAIEANPTVNEKQPDAPTEIFIDTTKLIEYVSTNYYTIQNYGLQKQLLENNKYKLSYWQQMTISPFARIAYYNRPGTHDNHNFDVGVTLRMPLSLETVKQKRAIDAKLNVIDWQRQLATTKITEEISQLLKTFYTYNDNVKGEFLRMKQLQTYIQGRKTGYMKVKGEYSRLSRLQEYTGYLQSWERLLEYDYQRKQKLIEIQSYLSPKSINDFIVVNTIK